MEGKKWELYKICRKLYKKLNGIPPKFDYSKFLKY